MRLATFSPLLAFVSCVFSLSIPHSSFKNATQASSASSIAHEIWGFAPGTWVENLAVRSNGQILATLLSSPQVYQVDPTLQNPATLVYTFPSSLGCLGITELEPDIFYVVVGNFSTTSLSTKPGTFSVWRLDLNFFSVDRAIPATATKVADFPQGVFLNGITVLDPLAGILLIADSGAGAIHSLNVNTGVVAKASSDPLMAPVMTGIDVGINGLKVRNGVLRFSNTDQALGAQVSVNPVSGVAKASAKPFTVGLTGADDFQVDILGNTFLAGHDQLRVVAATKGSPAVVVSNSSLLAGSTAVEFGRLPLDFASVYVTTNGGVGQYVTHKPTTPGRVVRVDVALTEY